METSNEHVIEWVKGAKKAAITAPNGSRLKNELLKLSDRCPDLVDVQVYPDGGVFGHVPVEFVKLRASRQLSQEQRERLAEMAKERLKKK